MSYIIGVPGEVLKDKNLSLAARATMCAIYDIANFQLSEKKEINITIDDMAKFLGIKKVEYIVIIQELYDAGYVDLWADDWSVKDILKGGSDA